MESRHMDVLEMDAASHNGVDDVREINDSVRYAPASARYKVYIIDEVHMLSKAAFNALLKTLEEPPQHAKFIFATTEIRKVPVTVLSRCQRFDLRRVEADVLMKHLANIAAKEGVEAEPEALGSSRAPPKARCAIRCRCSIRRSRMRRARCAPMRCGRCSASPTARASSICSNRWRAAISPAPSTSSARNMTSAPIRSWCCPISPNSSISSPA